MFAAQHSVIPVEKADLPTLARFLLASQMTQATNRFLFLDWPNESAQMSVYTTAMEQSFKDPHTEMFKVVDNVSGDIIASLILTRKRPDNVREDRHPPQQPNTPSLPEGINHEFRLVLGNMFTAVQKEMVGIDHFMLSSVFVRSSCRMKEIGSQLVRLCLDKAREAGVPLFLSSMPSARGFYVKQGFKDTTHADVDLSEWAPEYGGFGVYRLFGLLAST